MCNQEGTTLELQDANEGNQFSTEQQKVHNAFNLFLEVFIKGRKSLIVEYDAQFTPDDVENCLICLNGITKLNPDKEKAKKKGDGNAPSASDSTCVTAKDLQTVLTELKNRDSKKFKKYYILLWHCYWIMYLMNDTSKTFLDITDGLKVREKYPDDESGKPLFVEKEIAATDMAYSSGSIKAFVDILNLFKDLVGIKDIGTKTVGDIKSQILKNDNLVNNRAKNVLLYLCNPDNFPCIISQRHQDAIYKILGEFCEKEKSDNKFVKEKHVRMIEKYFIKEFGYNLYDKNFKPIWNISSINLSMDNEDKLSRDTLLKYKKAIVLYGPPGTSKSFEARTMSKNLLRLEFLKNLRQEIKNNANADNKSKLEKFIDDFIDICDERTENANTTNTYNGIPHIHRLQLHPGYTYDDFIIGKTIKRQNVQMQKGYLMRLIDKIRCDRSANTQYANLPHILILDEINRVDISRVFGELFTAMEKDYRKTGVDLPVTEGRNAKSWKLQVPEDLYIIGTMNMIDFSLEQVDFALRRRFAWIESNYEEKRLKAIIEEKRLKAITDGTAASSITDKEIKEFATRCTALNAKISNETSLGPAYQIGHAFFAEIVDIYSQVKSDNKQNPWDVAQNVLWSISIRPTLDAYCGSMDNEQKKQFIGDCKEVFIPKKSTDVSTNKQGAAQSSSGNE